MEMFDHPYTVTIYTLNVTLLWKSSANFIVYEEDVTSHISVHNNL